MVTSACAFVGAGSNIGDRLDFLAQAADLLRRTDGIHQLTVGGVYKTRPVGPAGPGDFYNTVFRLSLHLSPLQLWRRLEAIEIALGRPPVRTPGRLGARTIDLDILLYDDLTLQHEHLTVPHPRLTQRAFVLRPLCDLAPDWCHPESGLTMRELLAALPTPNEVIGLVVDAALIPVGAS